MAENDYAVLIGISAYPELGDNRTPLSLRAPINDVLAMKEWLLDPNGGQVPEKNVTTITSTDFPANPKALNQSLIVQPLKSIDDIYLKNVETNGPLQFGRRLYIFVSGHGFSPSVRRGSLFTADAVDRWGENVDFSAWLDFFQDGGYFREFVLLMDCCMNRISQIKPVGPGGRERASPSAPGPTFVAFAARRPLKAAEYEGLLKPNIYNGAFTSVLLEGLRGAASDRYGRVTGRSLADWIRNAQAGRLSPDDRADQNISKEPEVVQESPELIFSRVPPLTYLVNLTFPHDAIGKKARLWAGGQWPLQELTVTNVRHKMELAPGLYVVEVPDKNLRQGFEVLAPANVTVVGQGLAVRQVVASELFSLRIEPDSPAAEVFIIDGRFGLVEADHPKVETKLPFGIYKIKVRIGRDVNEQVVLLDDDLTLKNISPLVSTAALAPETSQTHEYQMLAADQERLAVRDLATTRPRPKATAAITIMARVWSGKLPRPEAGKTQPWTGITVVDGRGHPILDLADAEKQRNVGTRTGQDPFAIASQPVSPGIYYLRYARADVGTMEQSLVVPEGWGLEVTVLRYLSPEGSDLDPRRRTSIQLRDLRSIHDTKRDDQLVETARIALAEERKILNPELTKKLFEELDDPLAGMIGGHLLLLEEESGRSPDLRLLDSVVPRLRKLVGDEHPDVEALSLCCPDKKLRRTRPIAGPPMFERSWRLLVNASYDSRKLVPRKIWSRVVAKNSVSLYFVWSPDDEVRKKALDQLKKILDEGRKELPSPQDLVETTPPVGAYSGAVQTDRQSLGASSGKGPTSMSVSDRERTRRLGRRLDLPSTGLALLRRPAQAP